MTKNYGAIFTLTAGMLLAIAVALPILIFGIGAVVKAFQFMWSPVTSGSIPVWSLFVIGAIILIFLRRR